MKIVIKPKNNNISAKLIKKMISQINYNLFDNETIFKIILYNSYFKNVNDDHIIINNNNIQLSINDEASKDDWDIFIPITDIIDFDINFDLKVRQLYEKNYPNFDGVVILKNEENNLIIPIIGRKYFDDVGYIFNPYYNSEIYLDDLINTLEINKKYKLIINNNIKLIDINENDKKIYEFRKKFNFGIYKINKLRNFKRKKSATKNEFNKLVDECYVINLERRKDRMEHMINELKKIDVSYRIFNAVDGLKIKDKDNIISNPEVATIKSHMGVIKDAIYNEYDKIAIFEDDIIFCDDFDKRLKYYIENIPKDWDIMYLGSNLNSCQEPALIKHGIYKVKESYGCFAMILNNKNGLFQKIVNGENYNIPYDNYIRSLQKELNCYVFKPFFVKTLYTQSDINPDRGEFSYDIVDKYFAPVFEEPKPVQNKVQSAPKPQIESRTIQSICEDYQRGNYPFIIYYGGRVLFDSQYTDKSNIRFDKEYFILYGKYFPYRGMVIKRK